MTNGALKTSSKKPLPTLELSNELVIATDDAASDRADEGIQSGKVAALAMPAWRGWPNVMRNFLVLLAARPEWVNTCRFGIES